MAKIILFGGTYEGRIIAAKLGEKNLPTLVCTATEYGEHLLPTYPSLKAHTGRLDKESMQELLQREKPSLVIDATHPYAALVSDNILSLCQTHNIKLLPLLREDSPTNDDALTFTNMDELVAWLNKTSGIIFSTLGAKGSLALTAVKGYRDRVWLRILADAEALSKCCQAGFSARQIICMQGPFTTELNYAMFQKAQAAILLTKESGEIGGFYEKIEAARQNNMRVAILKRPAQVSGLPLKLLLKELEEEFI